MGLSKYPKKIRKQLRELAATAHANEMKKNLHRLSLKFDEWKQGQISNSDLNQSIHEYHDGAARELWKSYHYSDEDFFVARAVVHRFLTRDEMPDEVYEALKEIIENLQR